MLLSASFAGVLGCLRQEDKLKQTIGLQVFVGNLFDSVYCKFFQIANVTKNICWIFLVTISRRDSAYPKSIFMHLDLVLTHLFNHKFIQITLQRSVFFNFANLIQCGINQVYIFARAGTESNQEVESLFREFASISSSSYTIYSTLIFA